MQVKQEFIFNLCLASLLGSIVSDQRTATQLKLHRQAQTLPAFPLLSFSCPRILSGWDMFNSQVSLVSFKLWQFLPPWCLQPCDFWRVLLGCFCLMFFRVLGWDSPLWERILQRWSFFSMQRVGIHSVDMSVAGGFILTVELVAARVL